MSYIAAVTALWFLLHLHDRGNDPEKIGVDRGADTDVRGPETQHVQRGRDLSNQRGVTEVKTWTVTWTVISLY